MLNAVIVFMLCLQAFWLAIPPMAQTQKLEQVIADAKKEGEVTLVQALRPSSAKKALPSWKIFSPSVTASKVS